MGNLLWHGKCAKQIVLQISKINIGWSRPSCIHQSVEAKSQAIICSSYSKYHISGPTFLSMHERLQLDRWGLVLHTIGSMLLYLQGSSGIHFHPCVNLKACWAYSWLRYDGNVPTCDQYLNLRFIWRITIVHSAWESASPGQRQICSDSILSYIAGKWMVPTTWGCFMHQTELRTVWMYSRSWKFL